MGDIAAIDRDVEEEDEERTPERLRGRSRMPAILLSQPTSYVSRVTIAAKTSPAPTEPRLISKSACKTNPSSDSERTRAKGSGQSGTIGCEGFAVREGGRPSGIFATQESA